MESLPAEGESTLRGSGSSGREIYLESVGGGRGATGRDYVVDMSDIFLTFLILREMVSLRVPLLVGVVVVVGQARPRLVPRQAHWDSGHSQRRLNKIHSEKIFFFL